MSEVTAAFGLAEGSLTTVDDYDTFQCFKKSYALSEKIDVPYYLKDLQVTTPTLRSQFTMLGLRGLTGASTWKIHEDYFMEIFAGGCTQEPMDPTSKATIDFVAANDPTNTTQNICGTSGNQFIGQWSLRGFVDDRTVLVQFSFPGNLFIGFTKTYMTDFALLTIADHETYEDAFTMTFKGPSAGDYAGFNTTDVDAGPFQSNIGEVQAEFRYLDFSENCPAEVCENYLTLPALNVSIPNPNWSTDGYYPEWFVKNKCWFWPKAAGCPSSTPCADPAAAVLQQKTCVGVSNVECATVLTSPMVSLITNNVLDAAQSRFTPLGYELMWVVNTALTDMYYDIKYISNIPDQPNKVEIRFQEFFPYEDRWTGDNSDYLPANFTLVQHDHVIITVNDDCQIQEWDQVADFVEANAVTLAFGAIMYENGGLEGLLAILLGPQPVRRLSMETPLLSSESKHNLLSPPSTSALVKGETIASKLNELASMVSVESKDITGRDSQRALRGKKGKKCKDHPSNTVTKWFDCIKHKNAKCAAAAYNAELFQKVYKEENVEEVLAFTDEDTWKTLFDIFDFTLDVESQRDIGPHEASVRYVREIRVNTDGLNWMGFPHLDAYPFNFTSPLMQNEWALVELNDDCKLTKWDIYGDDVQQLEYYSVIATAVSVYEDWVASSPQGTKAPKMTKATKGPKATKALKKGTKGGAKKGWEYGVI